MKFGEYYNLSESDKDGMYANITKRLDDLESRVDKAKPEEEAKYSCVPAQTGDPKLGDVLIIIDVEKGTMEGRLATRGRLISHPLVYGTKVAFAIQRENGDRIGVVHTLPDGQLYNQFRITGDATVNSETNPIFRTELDTEVIWNNLMVDWINARDDNDSLIKDLRGLIDPDNALDQQAVQSIDQPVTQPAPDTQQAAPSVSSDTYGAQVTQTANMRPAQTAQPAIQQIQRPVAPVHRRVRHAPTAASERMRAIRFKK